MAQRENWGTKIGIILAVAGSAAGLGNFLRFPSQVCQHGGGAFMIPYFVSFLLLGLPLCWIEWTMGRHGGTFSHGSLPGIFDAVVKRPWAKYLGVLGLFVPLVIFFYYTYIEAWCLGYSVFSLFGHYSQISDPKEMGAFLGAFQGLKQNQYFQSVGIAYACFIVTFVANLVVIYKGLVQGIELLCKIAMPMLLVGGVVLMARIFMLGPQDAKHAELTINNALGFMWNPDFGALKHPNVWLAAAGQIFFTLRVGLGAIMTYASYLRAKDDVTLSSTTAAVTNELFEVIIGGSIVIPAAFMFLGPAGAMATAKNGMFDLGFITMPVILNRIPFGDIFGFYWFFLLFLAAITSSISLLQPLISFLEDEFGWNRHKAAMALGVVCFVISHACIFGLGKGVLDEMDFWGGTLVITVCAFVEVLVFIVYMGINRGWRELHVGADLTLPGWIKYVFYVTPFYLGAIILCWGVTDWVPWILGPFGWKVTTTVNGAWPFVHYAAKAVPPQPAILWTRLGLVLLVGALLALIHLAWARKKHSTGATA